jgi:hypothetical protein
MARPLRSEDEGKRIERPDGAVIGSVATVRGETAYVRPKSGLLKGWSSWICDPQCDGKLFPLDSGVVVGVEEGAVVVDPDRTLEPAANK